MYDTASSDVVSGEGCWWLRMAEVEEAILDRNGFMCIHEEATDFGLSSGDHDIFDDFGKDKDGCIE